MKSMKRVLALVLAMVMCLGLATVAMATEGTPSTGGPNAPASSLAPTTITVTNAAKGEKYTAYKLFDASVTGNASGSIVYTGTIPASLTEYFTLNENGYIVKTNKAGTDTAASPALVSALKTWAKNATPVTGANGVEAEGDSVTLNVPEYGYYVVTSTTGSGAAVMVTSTNPAATVVEKNVTEPTFPSDNLQFGKFVNTDGIDAKEVTANVGDKLTYTIKIQTTNYVTETEGAAPVEIINYTVTDTIPAWLDSVTVTGITVTAPTEGASPEDIKQEDGTFAQFNNKTITIPWDAEHYTNDSTLTITYTAVLKDDATISYGGAGNVNTASVYYNTNNKVGDSNATVKTYPMTIQKLDEGNNALAGAKFKIPGLAATGSNGVYTVTSYDATRDEENSTEMDCDANGKLVILGLKDITDGYSLTETLAPAGYNKLAAPQKGCNVALDVQKYTAGQTFDQYSVTVHNSKGTNLPSTGGIGTTIFYVIGGILVIGAGVLLVTKKRMAHHD